MTLVWQLHVVLCSCPKKEERVLFGVTQLRNTIYQNTAPNCPDCKGMRSPPGEGKVIICRGSAPKLPMQNKEEGEEQSEMWTRKKTLLGGNDGRCVE